MSRKLSLGKDRVFLNRESRLHAAKALCTALAPMSHSWAELRQLAYGYIDEAVDDLETASSALTYNLLRDVSMLAAKAEEDGQEALAAILSVVSSAIAHEDADGLYPHLARYVETDLPYGMRKALAAASD
ncbi:MAG TPA: hypothetical protein VF157_14910 [Chloroflexota bacterium]